MTLYDFLSEVHRAYEPRSYLEIGIASGRSLGLSRSPTIAVDPAFWITSEIHCDVHIVRSTSDEFFDRDGGLDHFPNRTIDFAFIDGLHWIEFALRDFINVERHTSWASVIVFDDVLPRSVTEASRDRGDLAAWTGDVFKITEVLKKYRPDLVVLPLDTRATGVLMVLGADPHNTVLAEHYDEIVAEYVYPDPQRVPEPVLRRETALDAVSIVQSRILSDLRAAREFGVSRESGWPLIRRSIEVASRPAAVLDAPEHSIR